MKQSCLLISLLGSAAAFSGPATQPSGYSSTALFGGARGLASTKDGKRDRVATVKGLLDTSDMIFTVPAGGITVTQAQTLRRSLPEGTTMSVIKNKLMNIAVEGTEFEPVGEMLKGSNMWFFIEEDIGGTVKAYSSFVKTSGWDESHSITGGNIEGINYDSEGVIEISKLPSKQDLIAMIAGRIKAVPTKVARVIKEPNSKLARAIKLATEEKEDA